ncbi:MAG TPA: tetratricopeptide repeat protein, partial [Bryobacteraceae bacterium]|nr:tetratricopeptide repeat protein [Bryobacteraceae bacterium]
MRKARQILAAIVIPLFFIGCIGRAAQNPDSEWRKKMQSPEDSKRIESLKEALKIAETFPKSDPRRLETLIRLAETCGYDDECSGKSFVDQALRIRAAIEPKDTRFAKLLTDLANTASEQGAMDDALKVYKESVALREKLLGPDDQLVAETYAGIANVYQGMNNPVMARSTMQKALDLRQGADKEQSAGFADLLEKSAALFARAKNTPQAKAQYERAISIREKLWGARDPRFVASMRKIATYQYGEMNG